MANMCSEYVNWLLLETFLHSDSKTVLVFGFRFLDVDPVFFVLNLLCKIPQFKFLEEKGILRPINWSMR